MTRVAALVVVFAVSVILSGCARHTAATFSVRGTVLASDVGTPILTDVVAVADDAVLERVGVRPDGSFKIAGTVPPEAEVEIIAVAYDGYAADAITVAGDVGATVVRLRPRPLPPTTTVSIPAGAFSERITTSTGAQVILTRLPDAPVGEAAELAVGVDVTRGATTDPASVVLAEVLLAVQTTAPDAAVRTAQAPRFAEGVTVSVRVPITGRDLNAATSGIPHPYSALALNWLLDADVQLVWQSTLAPVRDEDRPLDNDDAFFMTFTYPLADYLDASSQYRNYLPFALVYPPSDIGCFVGALVDEEGRRLRNEPVTVTVASQNSDYAYDLLGIRSSSLGLLSIDLTMPDRWADNDRADLGVLTVTTASGGFTRDPVVPREPRFDGGCGTLGLVEVTSAPAVVLETFAIETVRNDAPAPLVLVTVEDEGLDAALRAEACSSGACNTRVFTGVDGRATFTTAVREGAAVAVVATLPPSEGGAGVRVVTADDTVRIILPPKKVSQLAMTVTPPTIEVGAGLTANLDVTSFDGDPIAGFATAIAPLEFLSIGIRDAETGGGAGGPYLARYLDVDAFGNPTYETFGSGNLDGVERLTWSLSADDLEAIGPGTYEVHATARTTVDDFSGVATASFEIADAEVGGPPIAVEATFEALANWWATTPPQPLARSGTIAVTATFQHTFSDQTLTFPVPSDDESPLDGWFIDDEGAYLGDLTPTFTTWPEGNVEADTEFTFTFTFSAEDVPAGGVGIALRPYSNERGTILPSGTSLESGSLEGE